MALSKDMKVGDQVTVSSMAFQARLAALPTKEVPDRCSVVALPDKYWVSVDKIGPGVAMPAKPSPRWPTVEEHSDDKELETNGRKEETDMNRMIDTIIRAADALDAIGKRDLADALDGLAKEAAKKTKPHHKVGDKVFLKEDTPLPVTAVKIDSRFGACYEVKLWVMERDLREDAEEKEEAEAFDHGRDMGPTPRLPAG